MNKLILILLLSGCCTTQQKGTSAPQPISPKSSWIELSDWMVRFSRWTCVYGEATEEQKASKFCQKAIKQFSEVE